MITKNKKKAAQLGQAGGQATYAKYGPDHMRKLAKKMHAKRRKAARLAEAEEDINSIQFKTNMAKKRTVKLQGGEYTTVAARLADFHNSHKHGYIHTEYQLIGEMIMFTAKVFPDVKDTIRYFMGHSGGKLVKEKALEKLETVAVGRALAFAGFAPDSDIASEEEMQRFHDQPHLEETEREKAIMAMQGAKTIDDLQKIWFKLTAAQRSDQQVEATKDKLKETLASYEPVVHIDEGEVPADKIPDEVFGEVVISSERMKEIKQARKKNSA